MALPLNIEKVRAFARGRASQVVKKPKRTTSSFGVLKGRALCTLGWVATSKCEARSLGKLLAGSRPVPADVQYIGSALCPSPADAPYKLATP